VVGDSFTGRSQHAFITGPNSVIPEPEIYAMLLAGLGLVGCMTRRKKAKSLI
jgi:hypothetical protein